MDIVIKTTFSYTPEYTFIDTDGDVIVTIDEKEQKAIKDAMLILKENQAFVCIEVNTGDPEVVEDKDNELRFGHTCYKVYRSGSVYWHGQTKYDSADQYEAHLFHINDDLTFNLPE
jgi:hypothetical protein